MVGFEIGATGESAGQVAGVSRLTPYWRAAGDVCDLQRKPGRQDAEPVSADRRRSR